MKEIKLSARFVKELKELPENGMGYQVVNIIMKDGTTLLQKVVKNCEILVLKEDEDVTMRNVKELEIDINI